jgi:4-amino-4-deoxy-L-arabinose transferase-like glycosyltransferase
MPATPARFSRAEYLLAGLILLLMIPALLINLGLMTFIDDEAIRALVALEMHLSGNYITPTLNGDYYYNKPPLYNWFLLLFFRGAGGFTEWAARLATVVCLLGYAASIFLTSRRWLGDKQAFLLALILISCGRILFWDSLLGLIDIAFSWVIFLMFTTIFHYYERGKWGRLFAFSYALTAVGFMMKGLPAIVFQGLTLLMWFGWHRNWRAFFSWQHVLGGSVFVFLVGLYYATYARYNGLEQVLLTLFEESSKRTAVQYGMGKTVLHAFTFPFEMVYHFVPWSLLVLLMLRRDLFALLRQNRLMWFFTLVFAVNIPLYWLSVEVYPRYLLMHAPLFFGVGLYLYQQEMAVPSWRFHWVEGIWWVFLGILFLGSFAPYFLQERLEFVSALLLKTALLNLALLLILLAYGYWKQQRMLLLVLGLLLARIGFNALVLPDRYHDDWGTYCKLSTIEAAQLVPADAELKIYGKSVPPIMNSFHFTQTRGAILRAYEDSFAPGDYILIDPELYPYVKVDSVTIFGIRHDQRQLLVGRYVGG